MREAARGAAEYLIVVDDDLAGQLDLVEDGLLDPLAQAGPARAEVMADPAAVLAAFRRMRASLAEAVAGGPRVWAPNGRWEHAGLRLVRPDRADLDLLHAALRELSGALVAPPGDTAENGAPRLATLLPGLADAAEVTPAGLVGALARVLTAVELTPDEDTAVLSAALRPADGTTPSDVRLSRAEEDSWQRLAHRVTMVLTEALPLHRFLD